MVASLQSALIDSTLDGICLTDSDGAIVISNRPLRRLVAELGMPTTGTVPERPDPGRRIHMRRQLWLFTLILLGKLAGETKLDGIIDWINERQKEIKKLLNPRDAQRASFN